MSPPIIIYRLGNFFYRKRLKFLARLLDYLNRILFSVWLPSSAKIGKDLTLGYWGLGIVIHSDSVIGDRCQINQNVTIGRNLGDIKVPRIGNNVYIGAGSIIFGEIEIGDNTIVGSNSLVNKSVPKDSIVVGNPLRIIASTGGKTYKDLDERSL